MLFQSLRDTPLRCGRITDVRGLTFVHNRSNAFIVEALRHSTSRRIPSGQGRRRKTSSPLKRARSLSYFSGLQDRQHFVAEWSVKGGRRPPSYSLASQTTQRSGRIPGPPLRLLCARAVKRFRALRGSLPAAAFPDSLPAARRSHSALQAAPDRVGRSHAGGFRYAA